MYKKYGISKHVIENILYFSGRSGCGPERPEKYKIILKNVLLFCISMYVFFVL